jgi:hypothetical protein
MSLTTLNINKSTPQNFELIFPKLPAEIGLTQNELTLNIHQTVLPSLTLDTVDVPFLGGKSGVDSGNITFEPWYVHFTVDSEFKNWMILYKWITFINNGKNRFGRAKKEYCVDASFRILDNFNKEILSVVFINTWISMLGEVSFSFREGVTALSCTANFIYDRFEILNV